MKLNQKTNRKGKKMNIPSVFFMQLVRKVGSEEKL